VLAELSEVQRELELQWLGEVRATPPIEDPRYQFLEEIARGGAAAVWRVRDNHLQRETAIKFLLDSRDNRDMRARWEREARLCARLVHPGIVPIHELSSFSDQRPFVSMKVVNGLTLLQWLESASPPSLHASLEVFCKVCEAMAFAHQQGIIHRDLKPSNLMVGSFREVQIMDWGLAKELDESASRDGSVSGELATAQPQNVTEPLTGPELREVDSRLGIAAHLRRAEAPPFQCNG
jgi:serine/threonine protein kinase